jgi:hypothetical protein
VPERSRRARKPEASEPLPAPLPPAERTVGQLVAESIRLYGHRFWPSLSLGIPVAAVNLLAIKVSGWSGLIAITLCAAVALTASFIGACLLSVAPRAGRRRILVAAAIGIAVFLPFPILTRLFVLPGLAWLALVGLAVPAALVEGTGLRRSFGRALGLARADFVHALGGLSTLVILVFVTQTALYGVLQAQGEQAAAGASFLAGIVVSPLLFLGASLLYVDQAARVTRPGSEPAGSRGSARRAG